MRGMKPETSCRICHHDFGLTCVEGVQGAGTYLILLYIVLSMELLSLPHGHAYLGRARVVLRASGTVRSGWVRMGRGCRRRVQCAQRAQRKERKEKKSVMYLGTYIKAMLARYGEWL